MKLYNTLSRQIEEIKPLNPPAVTVYTCGPTVYDYPHIGNWFTFIRYDLLARTLKMSGFKPTWVMNITDVGHLVSDADEGEDKLEKGARREGKTAWDIATFYGKYFCDGLKRLNFLMPDYLPKATEHIEEQINLIKALAAKGYTYVIDDGVYYDTSKFSRYADFARLDLDEQQAGKRVSLNPQKHNPTDFALWKFSPKDHKRDMEWDSPWGKGFPGWHIECSAIAMKYLGDTVDIHAGGIDHLPVHHTNEIAQSEGATGKTFANYWMHTNHILIDNDKISKSLGNTITLEDVESRGCSLDALRLLVLESHYRTQSKFSWENLDSAQNSLKNLRNSISWVYQSDILSSKPSDSLTKNLAEIKDAMLTALQDDLNTPKALSILHEYMATLTSINVSSLDITVVKDFADFIEHLLGINILIKESITDSQKALINERQVARQAKDWRKSDELRDQLAKQGVGLHDNATGAIWYRL
jgi:cysteinyl-tRNA synthetase